jgi:hypothetical protein
VVEHKIILRNMILPLFRSQCFSQQSDQFLQIFALFLLNIVPSPSCSPIILGKDIWISGCSGSAKFCLYNSAKFTYMTNSKKSSSAADLTYLEWYKTPKSKNNVHFFSKSVMVEYSEASCKYGFMTCARSIYHLLLYIIT